MLIQPLINIKELKTPKPIEQFMDVICLEPVGAFTQAGEIYRIHFVSDGMVFLWGSHYIDLGDFYNSFRPFGWTAGKKPGTEKATIWPWKK